MRLATIVAAMVNLGITGAAHADFRLEMSGQEIREALGRRAIEDLNVGETAGVPSINTCSQDGSLFLHTMTGLTENVPGQTSRYMVTRQPDRRISVQIVAGDGGPEATRQMLIAVVAGGHLRNCKIASMSDDQLFRLTTINGLASDRAVFDLPPR